MSRGISSVSSTRLVICGSRSSKRGNGTIGTVLDQALLYCYHYDPFTGKYGLALMNLVRLGGLLTVAVMAMSIVLSLRRERRQQANAAHPAATGTR